MHGEVHPVHEDPVVRLPFSHSVRIQASFDIVHQRHHARPHLTDEVGIASILVVVEHGLEPVEGVVHDGVDVSRHRVFATQLTDGTLDTLRIEAQVVVHEVRLDGIATPRPTVALDTVHEELAGGQVHRIGCHLPNLVHLLVAATERTTVLFVEGCTFVVHRDTIVAGAFFLLNIDIAEGLGGKSVCCD